MGDLEGSRKLHREGQQEEAIQREETESATGTYAVTTGSRPWLMEKKSQGVRLR